MTDKKNVSPVVAGGVGAVLGAALMWFFTSGADSAPEKKEDAPAQPAPSAGPATTALRNMRSNRFK